MAVTQVVTRPDDDAQAQGGDFGTVSTSYRQNFRASCDSGQDRSQTVLKYFQQNSGSLPWMGKKYKIGNGIDALAECHLVTARFVEGSANPWLFDVEASFKTPQSDAESNPSEDGESEDPLEWLDDIEISYLQTAVPVETGVFHGFASTLKPQINNKKMEKGKTLAISNSACVPYDPPIEKEKDIRVIRISRSVKVFEGDFFDQFQGSVNKDRVVINKPFYGYKDVWLPGTARIKFIGGVFATQKKIRYWRQTVEVHIDLEGWRRKVLDRGMLARREEGDADGAGSTVSAGALVDAGKANHKLNIDADGYPLAEPVLFDGEGQPQRVNYPPVYGEWGIYREINFGQLAGRLW